MAKPKISTKDLCRNAQRIRTGVAEVKTFLAVETKNRGFDEFDRPLILFERHWFHKFTKGRFDGSHPNISNRAPGGYGTSASQYDRFSIAFGLDPNAAMKSASWGLGQVMGFNYAVAGFSSVGEFVDAMKESEGRQLDAAINFVIHNGLDDELRRHDWRGFARGYNGNGYEKNDYHNKLAFYYKQFSNQPQPDCKGLLTAADVDVLTERIAPSIVSATANAQDGDPGPAAVETTNEQPSQNPQEALQSSPVNNEAPPPPEKVVVEKEDLPAASESYVKRKWKQIAGWWGTVGGLQTLKENGDTVATMTGGWQPDKVLIGWIIVGIIAAFAVWFIGGWLLEKVIRPLRARWLTTTLINANANATTVMVASADKLDELEKQGYVVVRRA